MGITQIRGSDAPVADTTTPAETTSGDASMGWQQMLKQAKIDNLLAAAAEDVKDRKFEKALANAEAALALAPNNPVALNTAGAALVQLRRFEEGRTILERAVEINADLFEPAFNLGEVYFLEGNYAEAAHQFRLLSYRFGSPPVLKFKMFLSYLLAGYPDSAKQVLREIRFPTDGPAWYYAHAAMAASDGNRGEARRLMRAANAIHGGDAAFFKQAIEDSGLKL